MGCVVTHFLLALWNVRRLRLKTWYAPAKLNLFLHVVGRLDNGYHELQTVYQFIDWKDKLEFTVTNDGLVRRPCEVFGIPEETCLTVKAARALRGRCPGAEGVEIQLNKHIPAGSGLGGGSSDAAITLIALNELWGLDLSDDELAEIGAEVGADIPVFVYGKNAWAEGKGEILSDISLPECIYLVVVPTVEVSTRHVFREIRSSPCRERITVQDFHGGRVCNDLEQAACQLYPEVRRILDWLGQYGPARMTGSGGAVFLETESGRQAQDILEKLPSGCQGRICVGTGV